MERRVLRILNVLIYLVFIFVGVGWIGFMVFEKLPVWEALAVTINILSSVGLGENPAETAIGKFIIGILQFGSIGIVTVAIATLSQVIIAGAMKQYMGRKRMDERINKLNNHSIIAGYSLTGAALTKDLVAENESFVVIERDPETVTLLEEIGMLYIEGDATDEDVLKAAGIDKAKALFAVLSADSDNLMVTLSARGLNENIHIVSRTTREDYIARFMRAGANSAISPQEWASRRMVQSVLRPNLLKLLSSLLDPTVKHAYLDECLVPEGSPLAGKTLSNSGLRQAVNIFILGIARDEECISSPGPDSEIMEGDVLIGFGEQSDFRRLREYIKTGAK